MAKKKNIASLTLLGTVPALSLQAQGGAQAVDLGLQRGLSRKYRTVRKFFKINSTKSLILKTFVALGAGIIYWLLLVLDKTVANKKLEEMKSESQGIIGDLQKRIGNDVLEKMRKFYEECENYLLKIRLKTYYMESKTRLEFQMSDFLSKSSESLRNYVLPLDEEALKKMVDDYDPEKNKSTLIESVIPYARYFLDMKKDERAINELDVEIENFIDYVKKNDLGVISEALKKALKVKSSFKGETYVTSFENKILKVQREGDIIAIHKFLGGILNFLKKGGTPESVKGFVGSIGDNEVVNRIEDIDYRTGKIEKNLKKTHFFPGQYTLFS